MLVGYVVVGGTAVVDAASVVAGAVVMGMVVLEATFEEVVEIASEVVVHAVVAVDEADVVGHQPQPKKQKFRS